MCGIISVISKKAYGFVQKDMYIFEELLYADALRGPDSTGVIMADKYGHMYIDKSKDDAHDFLLDYVNSKHHKEAIHTGVVLIGHNRKGTVGKISDETAHPFVVNNQFAMVHNGTLYNHKKFHDTDVDSEALAKHIEEVVNGDDYSADKLGEALHEVYGAYACVWYNQKTNLVQFVRNDQRPLWYAESDDAWYLASEGSMLHWILTRNGVKCKQIETTVKDTLYSLSPGEPNGVLKVEVLPEKKASPTNHTQGWVGSTGNGVVGNDNVTDIGASKNKYKKIKKNLLGRSIDFWVSDYVEKYLFQKGGDADRWYVMGETDSIPNLAHMVRGEISLRKCGFADIDFVENYIFKGKVTAVDYIEKTREISIVVEDVVPLPPSIPTKQQVVNEETPVTLH